MGWVLALTSIYPSQPSLLLVNLAEAEKMTDQEFEELWEAMEVEAELRQQRIVQGEHYGRVNSLHEKDEIDEKV